jgi:RNA polymerase sigma-70 factor (ECF subfamily)
MVHDGGWTGQEPFGDLLCLARRGHREAVGKILDAFRRVLLHRVTPRIPIALRSRCAPSDLVQETLLEAQRDFASFRGETPAEMTAWLAGILRHNLGDLLRAAGCRRRGEGRVVPLEDPRAVGDLKERLADGRPGPEEDALCREQGEATRRALGQLSHRAQEAVRFRFEEHLPYEEIGTRLGCSADAARKLCVRALQEIGARCAGPPDRTA